MNFGVVQEPTPAMISAAQRAMEAALDLRPDDRVLVISDEVTAACAGAFAGAARGYGCTVTTYDLPPTGRPLDAVPADDTETLQVDVVHRAHGALEQLRQAFVQGNAIPKLVAEIRRVEHHALFHHTWEANRDLAVRWQRVRHVVN